MKRSHVKMEELSIGFLQEGGREVRSILLVPLRQVVWMYLEKTEEVLLVLKGVYLG